MNYLFYCIALCSTLMAYRIQRSNQRQETLGGCQWFGTAPWCDGQCPHRWTEVRRSSGRCEDGIEPSIFGTKDCTLPRFGHSCLRGTGTKKFCCYPDQTECTLTGTFNSDSIDTQNIHCRVHGADVKLGLCGVLSCRTEKPISGLKADVCAITGVACQIIDNLFNRTGIAACGLIDFYQKQPSHLPPEEIARAPTIESWYLAAK
ncbi:hypothetical protein Ddc_09901 [Ditylenchus destructor]|nr:hypothetical protein Ddc_09901 [Ditylenchus destructor]